jgi:hypothetical protein
MNESIVIMPEEFLKCYIHSVTIPYQKAASVVIFQVAAAKIREFALSSSS